MPPHSSIVLPPADTTTVVMPDAAPRVDPECAEALVTSPSASTAKDDRTASAGLELKTSAPVWTKARESSSSEGLGLESSSSP
mmetsp:Transcript_79679/g.211095  ORF Transcript_79679/g.211095 Transcript_79679/m.211095 type:complete len:83 (-) Transcript_79679:361-609(-)